MSTQPYNYEFRRPRYSNPTFLSSNVKPSMSFFSQQRPIGQPNHYQFSQPEKTSKINYQQNPPNQVSPSPQSIDQIESSLVQERPSQHRRNQSLTGSVSVPTGIQPTGKILPSSTSSQSLPKNYIQRNHLKDYGSHTLLQQQIPSSSTSLQAKKTAYNNPQNSPMDSNHLGRYKNLNQKDIFQKQNHQYNIISYQPKQYDEYIRKYPKLSLEDKDECFSRRYQLIRQENQKNRQMKQTQRQFDHGNGGEQGNNYARQSQDMNYQGSAGQQGNRNGHSLTPPSPPKRHGNPQHFNPTEESGSEKIAGMQTYKNNNNLNPKTQSSHQSHGTKAQNPGSRPGFDMKMLNHMDELNYYS